MLKLNPVDLHLAPVTLQLPELRHPIRCPKPPMNSVHPALRELVGSAPALLRLTPLCPVESFGHRGYPRDSFVLHLDPINVHLFPYGIVHQCLCLSQLLKLLRCLLVPLHLASPPLSVQPLTLHLNQHSIHPY